MRARRVWLLIVGAGGLLGCGGDPAGPADACMLSDLPLQSESSGPTVTDVALEDQGGQRIVVQVTATDPQGSPDLVDVVQTVGVFRNEECAGAPIELQDDLAGSGIEESFGTAVDASTDPTLYGKISGSRTWPVELHFLDAGGHAVTGRVAARVFR